MASSEKETVELNSNSESKELRFTTSKQKRLNSLLKERAAMNAEIERLQRAEAEAKRKLDTRKKVVSGAAFLNAIETGLIPKEIAIRVLDKGLVKEMDRKLFPDLLSDIDKPAGGNSL